MLGNGCQVVRRWMGGCVRCVHRWQQRQWRPQHEQREAGEDPPAGTAKRWRGVGFEGCGLLGIRRLDAGTAFEILSIDIADIDVGENIGATLQAHQAEADKARYQAEAEKRRAMAIAQEAEFRAEEQKNRALVVLAESEVPKAMAQAFREGNLGVMDYYKLNNVAADTSMRESIASTGEEQDISEE